LIYVEQVGLFCPACCWSNGICRIISPYRATGALQNLDYGNGTEMNVTSFNNRLQATEFEVKKDTTSIISKEYEFYADGQMKLSTDNNNAKFDR
jgi:hypothetical protein